MRAHGTLPLVLATAVLGCSHPRTLTLASFEGEITMHTTSARGGPHDMGVKAKGDKLRFEMTGPGGEPSHAIYDPASGKVILVLDDRKSYIDLDFGAKGAPAPNTDPSSSTITKAGAHRTIAGYDCEQWSVKDASGKRSEVCIAQGIAFFDLSRMGPGGAQPESALSREFREHKSFPLESIEYGADGKEIARMVVVKIAPGQVPDTAFALPTDYTKMDLPGRRQVAGSPTR